VEQSGQQAGPSVLGDIHGTERTQHLGSGVGDGVHRRLEGLQKLNKYTMKTPVSTTSIKPKAPVAFYLSSDLLFCVCVALEPFVYLALPNGIILHGEKVRFRQYCAYYRVIHTDAKIRFLMYKPASCLLGTELLSFANSAHSASRN
jgi:hypothetical protein